MEPQSSTEGKGGLKGAKEFILCGLPILREIFFFATKVLSDFLGGLESLWRFYFGHRGFL